MVFIGLFSQKFRDYYFIKHVWQGTKYALESSFTKRIAISIMILAKWTTIILHESVFLLIDKLLIWIKLQLFWKYFEIPKITSGELYFCGRSVVFLKTYSTDALNSLSTRQFWKEQIWNHLTRNDVIFGTNIQRKHWKTTTKFKNTDISRKL